MKRNYKQIKQKEKDSICSLLVTKLLTSQKGTNPTEYWNIIYAFFCQEGTFIKGKGEHTQIQGRSKQTIKQQVHVQK